MPIITWVLSHQPNLKVKQDQDQSIITRRQYNQDQMLAEPEITCKLHEKVVHIPKSFTTVTLVHCLKFFLWSDGVCSLWSGDQERKRLSLVHGWISLVYGWSLNELWLHYSSVHGWLQRTAMKEIPLNVQNFMWYTRLPTFWEKRSGQKFDYIGSHGQ